MPRLFDLVVMVDWSAASRPGPRVETKDQIWIAWGSPRSRPAPLYCRTRQDAFEHLRRLLERCRGSAVVGFDFPHSYPAGSGLGGGRKLAARLASLIDDRPDNGNNRFDVARRLNREMGKPPGPFWMVPAKAADKVLPMKRPKLRDERFEGRVFGEYRAIDRYLRAQGEYPQSAWKLCGAGSVGSQTLLGLPVIHRLLTTPALAGRSRVWPFETGWDARLDGIIHTEIWPSLKRFAPDRQPYKIKDARQVAAVRDALLEEDCRGRLRGWFKQPRHLSPVENRICLRDEGWIFGVA